ncbi:MAG: flagellar motor protein MotB [Candidatus Eisenbacteria bacterium]
MSQTVHHGGAWKVAFADFVTALMALFIVLWLVTQSPETKAAVAAYFNNPSIFPGEGRGFLSAEGAISLQNQLHEIEVRRAAKGGGDENQQSGATSELQQLEQEFLLESAQQIESALEGSPTLSEFDGQVSVEMTAEGLRIQVHDEELRPLFASVPIRSRHRLRNSSPRSRTCWRTFRTRSSSKGTRTAGRSRPETRRTGNSRRNARTAPADPGEANGIDPARITRVVGYADRGCSKRTVPLQRAEPAHLVHRSLSKREPLTRRVRPRSNGTPTAPRSIAATRLFGPPSAYRSVAAGMPGNSTSPKSRSSSADGSIVVSRGSTLETMSPLPGGIGSVPTGSSQRGGSRFGTYDDAIEPGRRGDFLHPSSHRACAPKTGEAGTRRPERRQKSALSNGPPPPTAAPSRERPVGERRGGRRESGASNSSRTHLLSASARASAKSVF